MTYYCKSLLVLFFLFSTNTPAWALPDTRRSDSTTIELQQDSLTLFDQQRKRLIPLALYFATDSSKPLKLALLNHGYGASHKAYSFVARNLVAHGYFMACIQHELPTDEPMPTSGNPYKVRMPIWKRGVATMHFVLNELKKRQPNLDVDHILLMGHSNGGDMSMLFAQAYPGLVDKVITFDNRRMPIPRVHKPHILSIRSSDQVADKGVLPTLEEQKRFGIRIVQLPAMRHNDMWDGASAAQKQVISKLIADFVD